jgi:hydrogenase maturation factor
MKNIGKAIEGIDEDALKTTVTVLTQIINNLTKEKS